MSRLTEKNLQAHKGTPGDPAYLKLISDFRKNPTIFPDEHVLVETNICTIVRKKRLSEKEKQSDYDALTCSNPYIVVHKPAARVDGKKCLRNSVFKFDFIFCEESTTEDLYIQAVKSVVNFVVDNGRRATVFAHGQTGSGKTYTMQGIQALAAKDIFTQIEARTDGKLHVFVAFFEIFCGHCQDLLDSLQRLPVRDDGRGDNVVVGLRHIEAFSPEAVQEIIERGNSMRSTHRTGSNDVSSRSHAICQISIRTEEGEEVGRLSLVDLAGSERWADSKHHNSERAVEGAAINSDLLGLKECIRAAHRGSGHIPTRNSELTRVLQRDFFDPRSRIVVIATVSAAAFSAEHTLDTLRFMHRLGDISTGREESSPAPLPSPMRTPGKDRRQSGIGGPSTPKVNPGKIQGLSACKAIPGRGATPAALTPKGSKVGNSSRQSYVADKENSSQQQHQQKKTPKRERSGDDADTSGGAVPNKKRPPTTVAQLEQPEPTPVVEKLLWTHLDILKKDSALLEQEGGLVKMMHSERGDVGDKYLTELEAIVTQRQALSEVLRNQIAQIRKQRQVRQPSSSKKLRLRTKA